MPLPPSYTQERTFVKPRDDGNLGVWRIYIDSAFQDTVILHRGVYKKNGEESVIVDRLKYSSRNAGRSNYKNPEMVAVEQYEKMIREKLGEGYVQSDPEAYARRRKALPRVREELPDFSSLETACPGFRPWKPNNNLESCAKLFKKAQTGECVFVRKMDGYGCMVVKEGLMDLYTLRAQRLNPVDDTTYLQRMPKLAAWLDVLSCILPDKTVLLGELIPVPPDRPDSREYVTSVLKSKREEAILKQLKGGHLGIYFWDVLILGGIPVAKVVGYQTRLDLIMDIVQSVECGAVTDQLARNLVKVGADPSDVADIRLSPAPDLVAFEPQILVTSPFQNPINEAVRHAKAHGWEGFVVTDGGVPFGDDAWSVTGRAKRPACTAKLKPSIEDDFVAMWCPEEKRGEYGEGRNFQKLGAVALYQWYGDELRYCGDCGSGFTEAERTEYMDLFRQQDAVVAQIEFANWTVAGKVMHARWVRLRDDKDIQDCVYTGPTESEE